MTSASATRTPRRASVPPAVVFALVLIPFVIEVVWVFWPTLQSVYFSLTRWDGFTEVEWIGLGNYTTLATDPIFRTALANTAIWLVLFGGLSFIGGLGTALLLQAERRGVAFYRTAMFLPVVFSFVVASLIWTSFFHAEGIFNTILRGVGLDGVTRAWLGDPSTALYAVIIAALWKQVGYVMVLYIAGLKALDVTLHDAGRIDGANAWQRLYLITFPQLRNVSLVVLAVLVIDSLRAFDIVWAMTRGGPFNSSQLLSTYMYSQAFQSRALGYASAIAVVIFLLALGVIVSYLVRAFATDEES